MVSKHRRITASLSGTILACLLAACGGGGTSSVPGVTDSEIVIGSSSPQSGPAASYSQTNYGAKAYFDSINAQGGINGRKIKFVWLDDGYNPSRQLTNVKQLVTQEHAFALVNNLGTPPNITTTEYLSKVGIPLIAPQTGSSLMWNPLQPWRFALQTSYSVEGKLLADYGVKTLGLKRIAILYQNDAFGKEGRDAALGEIHKVGGSVVETVSYETSDTDYSAQVLKLRKANPDGVMIWAVPRPGVQFLKTAQKLGLKPKWLISEVLVDPQFIKNAGSAAEGAYFASWLPLSTGDSPQLQQYKAILQKYADPVKAPIGGFTEAGMAGAQILVEGLRRAGKDLTRQKLIDALNTMNKYNDGLAHNVTYSPTDHRGQATVFLIQDVDGQFKQVTDYLQLA